MDRQPFAPEARQFVPPNRGIHQGRDQCDGKMGISGAEVVDIIAMV